MSMSLSLPQLGLSVAAGSLTTLSPCVFPMLPLVIGGALQAHRFAPAAMGLGMTMSFAVVGMLLGAAGPAIGLDPEAVRTAGAAMLVAFAAVMLVPRLGAAFTAWMLPIASSAGAASSRLDPRSLRGAMGLGAVLGLVWSPCSGPLLGSALTLVASEGGLWRGGLLLGLFGLGAAVPLVGAAYVSKAGFQRARTWIVARSARIQAIFAVVLALSGLAILSGTDRWLEAQFVRILPDAWINLTVRI